MTNDFGWDFIKDGFSGFEKLAHEYTSLNYPVNTSDSKWRQTSATRDGNRDSQAIIIGFQPHNLSKEQWWMEAKYSTAKKMLSRYRLDATIVSAILEGNVTKIIFVTNIIIASKTIKDIKNALLSTTLCSEVHFVTKYTLEYWLYQNTAISKKYFSEDIIKQWKSAHTFLSEEAECYSEIKRNIFFTESLRVLVVNETYYCYFSIYSAGNKTVRISSHDDYKDIEILSNKYVILKQGTNFLTIKFKIPETVLNQTQQLSGSILKLGSIDIILKYNVDIISNYNLSLSIEPQQKIQEKLNDSLKSFRYKRGGVFHCVLGQGGIGKSYIINNLAHSHILEKKELYFVEFTNDALVNNDYLCKILLFILFPYLDPNELDLQYIKSLGNHINKEHIIYKMIKSKDFPEQLEKTILETDESTSFFLDVFNINERYIFFDDIHKLSKSAVTFLMHLLQEINNHNLPIFILMCGRSEFKKNDIYLKFLSKNIVCESYYELATEDLVNCFFNMYYLPFKIDLQICAEIFPNIIEFLFFIKYYNKIKDEINNTNDFILACKLFKNNSDAEEAIIRSFSTIFQDDLDAKEVCNLIFWSVNGLRLTEDEYIKYSKSICSLLSNDLIRYNNDGNILPYHEIYQEIYRKHFKKVNTIIKQDFKNEYEFMRDSLAFSSSKIEFSEIQNRLFTLFDKKEFYSLLYILEECFLPINIKEFKNKLGDEVFYRIYVIYAHAMTNQSRKMSGKIIFQKIIDETLKSHNPEIMKICAETIFENINSDFEWLEFENAKKNIAILKKHIDRMILYKIIDSDIYKYKIYILTLSIEMLIACELELPENENMFNELMRICKTYNHIYEKEFFSLRYAETMYFTNTSKAISITGKAMKEIKSKFGEFEKFYLWAKMDFTYLSLITTDSSSIFDVIESHEKLQKDFFNDYRKRKFCIAQYFYKYQDINAGNKYLFSESSIYRELRPRQLGFYYQTLALHEIVMENHTGAIEVLQKAAKIFAHIPSYLSIIEHNITVLETISFNNIIIKYGVDGFIEKGVYVLDPRCIW